MGPLSGEPRFEWNVPSHTVFDCGDDEEVPSRVSGDDVPLWLLQDIGTRKHIDYRTFLKRVLETVLETPDNGGSDGLLDQCLERIIPICDGRNTRMLIQDL